MLKYFLLKLYCVFKIFVQYRSIYFIYINRSDKNMLECKDEKILFSLFQKIIILLKKCFHEYIFLDISIFVNPFISFQLVNAIRMSFGAFLFKSIYIFFFLQTIHLLNVSNTITPLQKLVYRLFWKSKFLANFMFS